MTDISHQCALLQVTGGVMMLCNFLDIAGIRDDVASMLQDKILAILVHFDQRLNNATISLSEKIKVRAVGCVTLNSVMTLVAVFGVLRPVV